MAGLFVEPAAGDRKEACDRKEAWPGDATIGDLRLVAGEPCDDLAAAESCASSPRSCTTADTDAVGDSCRCANDRAGRGEPRWPCSSLASADAGDCTAEEETEEAERET